MWQVLGSILLWVVIFAIFMTILFLVTITYIITYPFDKHKNACTRIMLWIGKWVTRLSPGWTLDISGDEILRAHPGSVVISNHQSFMDMPLHANITFRFKWVSRSELFKIPIMGWFMSMTNQLSIERGKGSAPDLIKQSLPLLADGVSVVIFPEGTRSRDNEIKKFKRGAFLLAEKADVPIIPIVIEGAYNTLKPNDWRFNLNASQYVRVLEPMYLKDFESVNEMMIEAERRMRISLASIREDHDALTEASFSEVARE